MHASCSHRAFALSVAAVSASIACCARKRTRGDALIGRFRAMFGRMRAACTSVFGCCLCVEGNRVRGRGGMGGGGHLVRLRGPFVVFLLGLCALADAPSPLGRGHCPRQGSARLQEHPLGPVDKGKQRGVRHRGGFDLRLGEAGGYSSSVLDHSHHRVLSLGRRWRGEVEQAGKLGGDPQ
jgi:hypothetical protein